MKNLKFVIALLCVLVGGVSGCNFTVQDTPELRAKMGEIVVPVPELPVEEQCLDIKGNISSSGEKIAHLPGGRNYEQTLIDQEGEQWFCSVEEAEEAGWRLAEN